MEITSVTNFRKNMFSILEKTIKYHVPIGITTSKGNAVLISEEEYLSIQEMLALESIPNLKEQLIKDKKAPLSEFMSESEADW